MFAERTSAGLCGEDGKCGLFSASTERLLSKRHSLVSLPEPAMCCMLADLLQWKDAFC